MKQIQIFIVAMIFSLTFISATTIYAGDSITLELEKPYEYYSIVGNTTEVILDIVQDGNNVTITPSKYSQNDSFEIIFFDAEKEIITVYESSGGGGGSRTRWKTEYVYKNITKYVDKEVIKEVPGAEVEKIVNKIPVWFFGLFFIILLMVIFISYIVIRRSRNNDE